jgi:prepilin-type N-terminal cleavage/methylation domain-containing protein
MTVQHSERVRLRNGSDGFSLVEFLVAMAVMLVGLVGVLGLFTHGLFATKFADNSLIAKEKAREALESIFTARNTQQVTFSQVKNVSNGGIFLNGFQSLKVPGNDGIVGTSDDGPIETMVSPGPDGVLGTADDLTRTLDEFQRQVSIAAIDTNISRITITIRYVLSGPVQRDYTVISYISRFR